MVEVVRLPIPSALYERLKRRADQSQRTIEAELLEVVVAATTDDELPQDLADALNPLPLLDDEVLWRAARNHFSTDAASQLELLHFKRQREGLTDEEHLMELALVRQYERVMLVRAQAAVLLKQRGYDIASLLALP